MVLAEPAAAENRPPGSASEREALYAALQPLVRRLIRQYGVDPELRQDLPGEIYCRFCQYLDAYDPGRGVPLRPYLISKLTAAAYTFARSHWRREKREVELDADAAAALLAEGGARVAEEDGEDRVAGVIRRLPEVLARVPERQRRVILARFYEGRSFEDIAESLGVRPATARSLLRHGLNRMRTCLANEGGAGPSR